MKSALCEASSRRRLSLLGRGDSGSSVIALAGAGAAEDFAVATNFAVEVDAFAAFSADDAFAFISGKLFGWKIDLHPLSGEEIGAGHFSVREHLLLLFVGEFGAKLAG